MQPTDRLAKNFLAVELVAQSEPGADRDRKWAERSKLLTPAIEAAMRAGAANLQVLRDIVDKPIRITSGLRPGKSGQHPHGQAADIQVDGMSPLELLRVIWQNRECFSTPLRQVIAETLHKGGSLDLPMGIGSGRWVHVAIVGLPGQPFATASRSPWLVCRAGEYLPWDPVASGRP